ncbi:NACHT domain-containing protein [Streptomyces sp. NBC_01429]|uniref:NACHT domain-containing protein n=1 Tax=Streptomyces sp. NBC_01429 TaxID=2903862 RepID=UPI002E2E00AD|nr:NACHT domain-containing protein [Streptomyces sp. NBC_01429]
MSAARVVAVLGETQGTGVLIAPHLVLTCAHVVGEAKRAMIAHPRRRGRLSAEVQWLDRGRDTALLATTEAVLDAERAAPPGRLRIGSLDTESPLPHCEIIGFPDSQRYGADGALELDQYRATVLPAAGSLRGVLVCELDHPAAAERHDGGSPLQGLSGAPVFAGPVLLGIVARVPRGREHLRVEGIPMDRILDASDLGNSFRIEPVTDVHPRDRRFEEGYARAVKARYRKTRIFGIDELGTNEATWDLDTAYLSLEAGHRERLAPDPHTSYRSPAAQPRRIDELLGSRPRALLRGEAGAGKTTLVWWLAAHAACGTLGPDLADLNGLVPFVVPLRTVHARGLGMPAPAQLPAVAQVLADEAPPGWVRRVLEAGRGFLLLDGVDEVPPAERENARVWLGELLDLYPATRCLATVRPLAVGADWLRSERFDELQLLPMRNDDIQAFVTAWHRAARLECDAYGDGRRADAERAELDSLETELRSRFRQSIALWTLARTPLLCAVICALHRRRGGLLPDTRWDLYRATLAMLLGGRDTQRRIGSPEGITMGFEEHQELLQCLAVWLVRGKQAQLSRADAGRQIEVALRRLPKVREQGTAAAVLTHLLNRSGLIQERADDEIQFIHRTFQDYLAARALIEGGSLPELLQNAHDEQWQDTVLLAVGHCRPHEVRRLIEGLLSDGAASSYGGRRASLYVLAARCLLDTVVVDGTVSELVADRIRTLVPPRGRGHADALVSLGAYVLPLLPEPSGLGSKDAGEVAELICMVGGSSAIPYARRFSLHESVRVRSTIATGWFEFPTERYAREVLAGMSLTDLVIDVSTPDQLRLLPILPPLSAVGAFVDATASQLGEYLPTVGCEVLNVCDNAVLRDVSFLQGLTGVRSLGVAGCPALEDLSGLVNTSLTALELEVGLLLSEAELDAVHRIPHLRYLKLDYGPSSLDRLPAAHPEVSHLRLDSARPLDLSSLCEWSSLRNLHLSIGSCTSLTHGTSEPVPAPQVTSLRLDLTTDHAGVAHLANAFPSLTTLDVFTRVRDQPLDLPKGLPRTV